MEKFEFNNCARSITPEKFSGETGSGARAQQYIPSLNYRKEGVR